MAEEVIQIQLKDKLFALRDLFDRLFYDISPTKVVYNRYSSVGDDIGIRRDVLSDSQCLQIEHLAGFIASAVQYFENSSIKQLNKVHNILSEGTDDPHDLKNLVDSLMAGKRKSDRTISLLHEYLTNEINRSEDLANKVKELETELVNKTDELLRVTKALKKAKNGLQCNDPSTVSVSLNEQPQPDVASTAPIVNDEAKADPFSLEGCYIRKKFDETFFFGLVVRYNEPYYLVVYEDSDFEDLSRKEIDALLWTHSVPTSIAKNCRKHAKKLRFQSNDKSSEAKEVREGSSSSSSSYAKTGSQFLVDLVDDSDAGSRRHSNVNGNGTSGGLNGHAKARQTSSFDSSAGTGQDEESEGPKSKRRRNSSIVVNDPDTDIALPRKHVFGASQGAPSQTSMQAPVPAPALFQYQSITSSSQSTLFSSSSSSQGPKNGIALLFGAPKSLDKQPPSTSGSFGDTSAARGHAPSFQDRVNVQQGTILFPKADSAAPMFCPSADLKVQKRQPIAAIIRKSAANNASSLGTETAVPSQNGTVNGSVFPAHQYSQGGPAVPPSQLPSGSMGVPAAKHARVIGIGSVSSEPSSHSFPSSQSTQQSQQRSQVRLDNRQGHPKTTGPSRTEIAHQSNSTLNSVHPVVDLTKK